MVKDPGLETRLDWHLGEGWAWAEDGAAKIPGASAGLDVIAPIEAGRRYLVTVAMTNVSAGGLLPGIGGVAGGDFLVESGEHRSEITAGGESFWVGLLASENFAGAVHYVNCELID